MSSAVNVKRLVESGVNFIFATEYEMCKIRSKYNNAVVLNRG
jgi:hypothetical protein